VNLTIAISALAVLAASPTPQAVKVDAAIPTYKPVEGVTGTIKSVGSDTMLNLATFWTDDFKKVYPGVTIEVEGKGSGTAPPALIAGTSNIGPMSRAMKDQEIDDFEKKFGYKPASLKTSIDMLAVFVHKDNPIKSLSVQQLDAIFSKTRKSGAAKDIVTWGELGLTGEWKDKPISLYGRNSVSGTYVYFKEHALAKGDFKDTVKEQPGSSGVIQSIASDKYAIGYSGIGYLTADVRAVALSKDDKSPAIEAIPDNAYTGKYPLARFLYIYFNQKPGEALDPLRKEFLRFVLSQQGQAVVVKDGFFPLPMRFVEEGLKTIGVAEAKTAEASAPAKGH
jgi:phosphate transport system substrate-binding protein